jgi:hypothetical protein
VAPIGIGARPTECAPGGVSDVSDTFVIFHNPNGTPNFRAPLPTPSFQTFVQSDVDFGAVDVQGFSNTLINYLVPSGGVGLAAVSFYVTARNASVLVCPQSSPCVGSIELPFHASFGSIRGQVVRSDGSPAGAGFAVAAYRLNLPGTPQRSVLTDANGRFTFNLTEANLLLNENRTFGLTFLAGVTIPNANNWGLSVDPTSGGPARRPYALVAGSGTPPFNTPGQRIAKVQSSQTEDMTLIVDLPTDGCPVAPLSPITDPDAQDFEANDKVFRTHDRSGQSKMAAGMLPLTGSPIQGRIACLQDAISRSGGRWVPESAWRPAAYQDHLHEILTKWFLLWKINNPRCDAVKAQVQAEKNRHGIGTRVGRKSAHTAGEALDIATDRPRPCVNCFDLQTPPNMPGEVIDALAQRCGLRRLPPGRPRFEDPGHFSTTGR